MSEWRGLHNPDRHAPTSVGDLAWCNVCDSACYTTAACCCCLAAEVNRLTALLKAADDVVASQDRRIEKALDRIQDAINTVLQQAQGVREFGGSLDWARGAESAAEIVQDALRGES